MTKNYIEFITQTKKVYDIKNKDNFKCYDINKKGNIESNDIHKKVMLSLMT